jgi:hypothetical protein
MAVLGEWVPPQLADVLALQGSSQKTENKAR